MYTTFVHAGGWWARSTSSVVGARALWSSCPEANLDFPNYGTEGRLALVVVVVTCKHCCFRAPARAA